jgi:Tn3 transposase DDE domain
VDRASIRTRYVGPCFDPLFAAKGGTLLSQCRSLMLSFRRSTIAQVGGKKELSGRTDIQIEISNQCARLIANAIIYYNSAILSRLLTKYEVAGNAKALELITQMSPAAWRHILLNGHYTFQSDGKMIDLDALVAELELG